MKHLKEDLARFFGNRRNSKYCYVSYDLTFPDCPPSCKYFGDGLKCPHKNYCMTRKDVVENCRIGNPTKYAK